ncbi:hypothetical protein BDF21DRAFT_451676 [Thamnidium elegans]|nr:hypothetical protein BDF21DRAFT_451676 [Thamnidium elegans]
MYFYKIKGSSIYLGENKLSLTQLMIKKSLNMKIKRTLSGSDRRRRRMDPDDNPLAPNPVPEEPDNSFFNRKRPTITYFGDIYPLKPYHQCQAGNNAGALVRDITFWFKNTDVNAASNIRKMPTAYAEQGSRPEQLYRYSASGLHGDNKDDALKLKS